MITTYSGSSHTILEPEKSCIGRPKFRISYLVNKEAAAAVRANGGCCDVSPLHLHSEFERQIQNGLCYSDSVRYSPSYDIPPHHPI